MTINWVSVSKLPQAFNASFGFLTYSCIALVDLVDTSTSMCIYKCNTDIFF